MPRRSGRPSSAASLHISKPDMSVNNVPNTEQSNEVRVVVQQLPAVELAEDGGERLIQHCTSQQLSPSQKEDVEQVRTRLRPHRSSWRNRFAPDETSPVKPSPATPVDAPHRVRPKVVAANYPSEDVASIERNLQLPLQQSTSPTPDKQKVKAKRKHGPLACSKASANGRKPDKKNRTSSTEIPAKIHKKSLEVKKEKISQSVEKTNLVVKDKVAVEEKKKLEKPSESAEEIDPLNWQTQNKQVTENVQDEENDNSTAECSKAEALQIAYTVQNDELIQKFGVRLLGMSLDPEQKILAVSQRMIELVRLLRAAQGVEPKIESLTHLLHYQHWPIITQAILYVTGYQEDSNTFRNPAFVFDIGQAMKFSAHILKNEASSNMDTEYEWQLKEFMNSIDAKINEILPNAFQYRNCIDENTMRDDENAETAEDINELITTLNGDAGHENSTLAEMLPAVIEQVSASSKLEPGEGESQASLLLELSRGYGCDTDLQTCQPQTSIAAENSKTQSLVKTLPVVATNENKRFSPSKVRILKIVNPSGQASNRKYCLIIPSEVVQNSKNVKSENPSEASMPVSNSIENTILTSTSQITSDQEELILAPCGDINSTILTSCSDVTSSSNLLAGSEIRMLDSSGDANMTPQASDLVSVSATLLETAQPVTQLDPVVESTQQRHTLASLCGVTLENDQQ